MKIQGEAQELLIRKIDEWGNASSFKERVCVYATGSYGRGDASTYSDLDLFIISKEEDVTKTRLVTGLEEIELLASIVHVNRELGLPEPDADGSFLSVHGLSDYLIGLGKPSDDANNTFTGRLLLLLESRPIFGDKFYDEAISECVERYWIDYHDHTDSFIPAFLINDILRFWRTLCVNYEAGLNIVAEKRRAKNYKLKHSRMLICFSAIIALQAFYKENKTISPDNAQHLLKLDPIRRLLFSKEKSKSDTVGYIDDAISLYEKFLQETDCSQHELYEKMKNPDYYKKCLSEARQFGDAIFCAMQSIAVTTDHYDDPNWRFFRYVTV